MRLVWDLLSCARSFVGVDGLALDPTITVPQSQHNPDHRALSQFLVRGAAPLSLAAPVLDATFHLISRIWDVGSDMRLFGTRGHNFADTSKYFGYLDGFSSVGESADACATLARPALMRSTIQYVSTGERIGDA
eukprot:2560364-Rhodomonas_salina.2